MAEEPITLRVRLQGYALAIRESWALAAATSGMGTAAEKTERSVGRLQRRSFLMNQALFTMRRYIYQGTLALTAMGGVAAAVGIKFNVNMEKARIGMEFLLGNTQAANEEINYLFELAAKTPFQFQPLTETARTMLAFGKGLGFGVNEVNRLLRATADVVSVMGGSQEVIDRVTYALGQMLVKGRVMGEELRQLMNANIPAARYLAEAFNLNAKQLSQIGRLGIPAREGILAIITGMEREYAGAAAKLADTVWGQTSTLIDYTQQLLGMMLMAPFLLVQRNFPRVLDVIQAMTEAMRDRGFYAMVQVLDDATVKSGQLTEAIHTLDTFIRQLWASGGLLFEAFTPFLKIVLLLSLATLQLTNALLDLINKGGEPLIWVIRLLVLWMVIERITMKALLIWMRRDVAVKTLQTFWTKRLNAAYRIQWFLTVALTAATKGLTTAVVAFNTAVLTNPLAWVLIGVVALIAGLIYLWYRFEKLRVAIGAAIFALSPLTLVVLLVRDNIKALGDIIQWVWDKLIALDKWLDTHTPFKKITVGPDWLRMSGWDLISGQFQGGGMAGVAGRYLVGERGREIVDLPAGARVTPVAPMSMNWGAASAAGVTVNLQPAPVLIDGREVAEVVFRHRADRIARR